MSKKINIQLLNKVRDIIQSEIYLRDVPYSLEDGAQEVDPSSMDDAAYEVIKMISEELDLPCAQEVHLNK